MSTIEQAFKNGDPLVHQAVLETARYMGMAISNLVGALDIQKIVLTGDMTRFGEPWLEVIQGIVSRSDTLQVSARNTDRDWPIG